MNALEIYAGSDGQATRAFYAELEKRGPAGALACNLLRAQKASARAKVYRGGIAGKGSFRSLAYEKKAWSLQMLCTILGDHAGALGIAWGWQADTARDYAPWVLYVDLPQGQVSFHSLQRMPGPDYSGHWDGKHASAERIIDFCDSVLNAPPLAAAVLPF